MMVVPKKGATRYIHFKFKHVRSIIRYLARYKYDDNLLSENGSYIARYGEVTTATQYRLNRDLTEGAL